MKLSELLVELGACMSNGETRRILMQGAVKINGQIVRNGDTIVNDGVEIKIGRNESITIGFSELKGSES
jgi:predicted rRNA methylase YqxC with S4 and FtsJ domains